MNDPRPIGLYVHIPFCVGKCHYCDFCSFPHRDAPTRAAYLRALCAEAEDYRGRGLSVDTVYFGGGTPSLLSGGEFSALAAALASVFSVAPGAECTLEANPGTLTPENLSAYRAAGVNRISLGLQSVHQNELKILGRLHTYPDFLRAYKMVRDAGFDNVSVDVMYGIPTQTVASFGQTLRALTDLRPAHISAYALTLEEGTSFYRRRDTLAFPGEDAECAMYDAAVETLAAAGYEHYEISNFARPGKRSRHNLKYWRDEEYIGLGVAAYSYLDGVRYGNPRDFAAYLRGDFRAGRDRDVPGAAGEPGEYAMLAFRLSDGLDLAAYERRFGVSFLHGREEKIALYTRLGYLSSDGARLRLTDRGFFVSNSILAELL